LRPGLDQFRYSPAAAAFFAPWSLLPDGPGGVLWRLLNIGVFLAGLSTFCRIVRPGVPLSVAALLSLPLALGSINNGQANPLAAGLILLAVAAFAEERWWLAAGAVVAATAFKGYPLAVGLLLCVAAPRPFAPRLAACVAVWLALPFALQTPEYVAGQYGGWWFRLVCDDRSTWPLDRGYHDLRTLLRAMGVAMPTPVWKAIQAAAGLACALGVGFGAWRGWGRRRLAVAAGVLGMVWMTLLGPATETCTWVLFAPAVAWAAWAVRERSAWERAVVWGATGLFVIVVVALGFPAIGRPLLMFAPQPLAGLVVAVWLAREVLADPAATD
jgi:hypothetical protein